VAGLDARVALLEQRLAEEVRESGRLQNTLDGVLGEHRIERSRTLREMTDLKKLAARLKGLDSNHLVRVVEGFGWRVGGWMARLFVC
jgi:hypothetical protein